MTTTSQPVPALPGRLGDPARDLRSDPRADPRMVAALAPFGLDTAGEAPPVGADSPREAQLEYIAAAETGFEGLFAALTEGLPPVPGVTRSTETITGPGGHEITLFISRPTGATGPLPGILHIHGGGMVILQAAGPAYVRLRDALAATGMVVVGVEYRNGAGVLGTHPFPAGLDDCTTALEWMHEHRADLGISSIVPTGESGGANLALALTLKAKRDGHLDLVSGTYAMVPYVSGLYGRDDEDKLAELPSMVENEGYFLTCASMAVMAEVYDPGAANAQDPLAWPHHATDDDLRGLPPHVISVCELDPLRDEGLAYYRRLLAAGVDTTGRMVLGVVHAGDIIFQGALPDVFAATVQDVHRFASRF